MIPTQKMRIIGQTHGRVRAIIAREQGEDVWAAILGHKQFPEEQALWGEGGE